MRAEIFIERAFESLTETSEEWPQEAIEFWKEEADESPD